MTFEVASLKRYRIADEFVDLNGDALFAAPLEERPDACDHLACMMPRSDDLPKRCLCPAKVRNSGSKPKNTRICIRHDACQRLVNLVSNRSRQFAGGCHAIDLREVGHRLARCGFRDATSATL